MAFHDFCTRRIANLLEQSKHIIQAHYSQSSVEQQSMSSPLSSVLRRKPITCTPDTPIRDVLRTMQDKSIGSMVAAVEGRAVGIFTLHDVLKRVALVEQLDLSLPIINIMTTELTTLSPQALVYEAALTMAKHGFRHVLVSDNEGQLQGVISEKDLFTLQRIGLRQVGEAIRNATTREHFQHAAEDIRQLGQNMMAQGVGAEQLTQMLSTLNDMLTQRIIEHTCERAQQKPDWESIDFCWLAMGSEGRYEQTLNTDQDNGIIFHTPAGKTPDEIRAQLLPFAKLVNDILDACGFPLCKGDIMASNPKWCLSLEEWENVFSDWIFRGDGTTLLNASIFFDFRELSGNAELARELRTWLHGKIKENRQFLKKMVENALDNRPPLGFIRDFVLTKDSDDTHSLDLKINGVTPFVDAARIFALASGVSETNTAQRLRAAGHAWKIESCELEAWVHAFQYIQLLRLRLQHEQLKQTVPLSNRVDPETLNQLDRRILKESFRQARKLQNELEKYFSF
jgi:CBS domain-containing protein